MSTYVKKYNTIYAQFMKDTKVKEVNVSRYWLLNQMAFIYHKTHEEVH